MKPCCIESFVNKGLREHFRLAVENEGHTCEVCHTVWRYRDDTKWQPAPDENSTTMNVVETDETQIDLGWAKGMRDRARGVLIIQCWGCGGITEIPDRPFIEMHFAHAIGNCSLDLANRNRQRGVMPNVH